MRRIRSSRLPTVMIQGSYRLETYKVGSNVYVLVSSLSAFGTSALVSMEITPDGLTITQLSSDLAVDLVRLCPEQSLEKGPANVGRVPL